MSNPQVEFSWVMYARSMWDINVDISDDVMTMAYVGYSPC